MLFAYGGEPRPPDFADDESSDGDFWLDEFDSFRDADATYNPEVESMPPREALIACKLADVTGELFMKTIDAYSWALGGCWGLLLIRWLGVVRLVSVREMRKGRNTPCRPQRVRPNIPHRVDPPPAPTNPPSNRGNRLVGKPYRSHSNLGANFQRINTAPSHIHRPI